MNPDIQLSFDYNRRLLSYYSKSFYMSTFLLPKNLHQPVFALYGFCRFVDNLVDKPRQRPSDEIRLELERLEHEIKMGYKYGESEHPVLSAFIDVAQNFSIPIEHPQNLIKGVLMDLEQQRYETFDDLYLYCYRVAGIVGLMMTHLMGYTDDSAFEYAAKLGIAMQLTNILRDVMEDAESGRIYIPFSELRSYHVSEEDILEQRFSPQLRKLIKFSAERAAQYYQEAQPGIALLTKNSQFAIYAAGHIYSGILGKLAYLDYNPFVDRVYVSQTEKMRIILRHYLKSNILKR